MVLIKSDIASWTFDQLRERKIKAQPNSCVSTLNNIYSMCDMIEKNEKANGRECTSETIKKIVGDNLNDLAQTDAVNMQMFVKEISTVVDGGTGDGGTNAPEGNGSERGENMGVNGTQGESNLAATQGIPQETLHRVSQETSQGTPRAPDIPEDFKPGNPLYDYANNEGYKAGIVDGKEKGYEEGYHSGYEDGGNNNSGQQQEAYQRGVNEGRQQANNDANARYNQGYEDGRKGKKNAVTGDNDTPLDANEFSTEEAELRDDEMPIHENYHPNPLEWIELIRTVKWNMAHPGMQKNLLYLGDKGLGKTTMITEASELLFGKLPYLVTSPQADWKLTGSTNAMGEAVISMFVEGFTHEGITLIDEIEKSVPEALVTINAALANHFLDVPGMGIVKQHPKCTIIATSNTSGRGASARYNTANQIDESTRDRFIFRRVEWYHKTAEMIAAGDNELLMFIEEWNNICKKKGLLGDIASYRAINDIHADIEIHGNVPKALRSCLTRYGMDKPDVVGILHEMDLQGNKYWRAMTIMVEYIEENERV